TNRTVGRQLERMARGERTEDGAAKPVVHRVEIDHSCLALADHVVLDEPGELVHASKDDTARRLPQHYFVGVERTERLSWQILRRERVLDGGDDEGLHRREIGLPDVWNESREERLGVSKQQALAPIQ